MGFTLVNIDLDTFAGNLPKYMADVGFDEIRGGIDALGQELFRLIEETNRRAPKRALPPPVPWNLPGDIPTKVFRYVRCHNLFTGSGGDRQGLKNAGLVRVEYDAGGVHADFKGLDQLFDTFLRAGCVPFVELGFMPPALALSSEDAYTFDMPEPSPESQEIVPGKDTEQNPQLICNSPPRSYRVWGELVELTARHLLARYGPQACYWPFELWNEPDLFNFFAGPPGDYFKLYEATTQAIKRVDPSLLVGGPAVASSPDYLREFLAYVFSHQLPLDFVSFHVKGGSPANEPHPSWKRMLKAIDGFVQVLSEFPQFFMPEGKNIPVLVDEADPFLACVNGVADNAIYAFRETTYYPSFLCRLYREVVTYARSLPWLQLFSLFSDNLHFIDDKLPFGGYRSLATTVPVLPEVRNPAVIVPLVVSGSPGGETNDQKGAFPRSNLFTFAPVHPAWLGPFAVVKRPVFHVYSLFQLLGDLELGVKSEAIGPDHPLVVIASKATGTEEYAVLAANHREDFFGPGETLDVEFQAALPRTKKGLKQVTFTRYDLSGESHSAYTLWKDQWGEPEALNAEQLQEMQKFNSLLTSTLKLSPSTGTLAWTEKITPNSIYLWRFSLP